MIKPSYRNSSLRWFHGPSQFINHKVVHWRWHYNWFGNKQKLLWYVLGCTVMWEILKYMLLCSFSFEQLRKINKSKQLSKVQMALTELDRKLEVTRERYSCLWNFTTYYSYYIYDYISDTHIFYLWGSLISVQGNDFMIFLYRQVANYESYAKWFHYVWLEMTFIKKLLDVI